MDLNQLFLIDQVKQKIAQLQIFVWAWAQVKLKQVRLADLTGWQNIIDCFGLRLSNLIYLLPKMLLVKFLNLLVFSLIIVALYNLFFGIDSKRNFLALQKENQELLLQNKALAKENNLLESGIQSKQKNDAHAEKFAREELNLIYQDEQFLKFKENKPNEPQQ